MSKDIEMIEVPKSVLDLVRFMCETWEAVEDSRGKAMSMVRGIAPTPREAMLMRDFLAMHWPAGQGTKNRSDLSAIGKQPYESDALRTAVRWMLEQQKDTDS